MTSMDAMDEGSELPSTEAERRYVLRRFVGYAFRDLMQYAPRATPECVPARVWLDFQIALLAWQRRGYRMDS